VFPVVCGKRWWGSVCLANGSSAANFT